MKLKHLEKRLMSLVLTSALALGVLPTLPASADWQHIGCMGDLDRDQKVTFTDLVRLTNHILAVEPLKQEHFYEVKGATIGINGADGFQAGEYLNTADINEDGEVNAFDLALLRRYVLAGDGPWVWQWMDETTPEIPDTPDEPETPVDTTGLGNFISPPIQAVSGFLPSQGDAGLVILYVDFPDCPYDYAPSTGALESIAFAPEVAMVACIFALVVSILSLTAFRPSSVSWDRIKPASSASFPRARKAAPPSSMIPARLSAPLPSSVIAS